MAWPTCALRPVQLLAALALFVRTLALPANYDNTEPQNFEDLKDILNEDQLHAHYKFNLTRANMHRQGTGEFWLSFANDVPRMRLRGAARSPRFGDGEITIVVDSGTRMMYALFKLGELHEHQCVKYPFPTHASKTERIKKLAWRRQQVLAWQDQQQRGVANLPVEGSHQLLSVNWTKSYSLQFLLGDDGKQVEGVDLRQGARVIKSVRLHEDPEHDATDVGPNIFGPPSNNCTLADEILDPLARVELKPPHRQSSALNDLLLVLSDRMDGGNWPQLFVMLSAITVPGDVAVMIEDPEPPHPENLGGVAFDYTAEVISRGVRHTSDGSIWLNLRERAFRLRGEAKKTKVGPLFMDLIARGDEAPNGGQVYANVNLTVQEQHQCVAYDYPKLDGNATTELKSMASQGLSFFAIAELNGEDCGIFVAPLARGRWIHLWVDMESDNPDAILRSEIHKSGRVLRSTDVLRWHTGEDIGISVRPAPAWGCNEDPGAGQLAHLGLKDVHKRSIELQDALYSLHSLPVNFAVLEVLALTGDVAIMVQEPELPELWKLPAVSFSYSLYLGPANGDPAAGGHTYAAGNFAADLRKNVIRMTAGAMMPGATNISVALDVGLLSVRVEESNGGAHCLTIPLDDGTGADANNHDERFQAAGIFDGVEAIGEAECNRFTFLGTGAHAESVEFWFSKEENAVCRLEVLPPAGDDGSGLGALINVPEWEPVYAPGSAGTDVNGKIASLDPSKWNCRPAAKAAEEGESWLSLASQAPPSSLPSAVALAKLAEASGVVGLLPPRAANTLSRLVISSPSSAAAAHPPPPSVAPPPTVDIFGPELRTFAFSFLSRYPLQVDSGVEGRSAENGGYTPRRQRGSGELRVDLAKRRLYLRSEAKNVSAGIPQVESRVIFRGDRGRLYARTQMQGQGQDGKDFEQCWSVRTVEAVPAPEGGEQPNPFARGKLAGKRFSVPDENIKFADKYVFYLNQRKRVELMVDDHKTLAAINLDDLSRDVSAGITVHDWSTGPIDDGWFEPSNDWKCEDLQFLEYAEHIAEWDLIRVFFPVEPVIGSKDAARRLLNV